MHDWDFDITFCNGETTKKVCPVRDTCKRYWTEKHTGEAERLGLKYHSFFLWDNPDEITDKGCKYYWEKPNNEANRNEQSA